MTRKETPRQANEKLVSNFRQQDQPVEAAKPLINPLRQEDLAVRSYGEYMRKLNEARSNEANEKNSTDGTSGKPQE